MYQKGQGVTRDQKEAVRWFRKAAERGFAGGQLMLAKMYAKGWGVMRDDVMANV